MWYPVLAPSAATIRLGRGAASEREWQKFARTYRSEMRAPAARQSIILLAALSAQVQFAVGCYCADESRCHRTLLRGLLLEQGAITA